MQSEILIRFGNAQKTTLLNSTFECRPTLLIQKQQHYRIEKSRAIKISFKIARAAFQPEVNS